MTDTKKQILDLRKNSTRQELYHRHSSSLNGEVVEMFTEAESPKKTTFLFRNLEGPESWWLGSLQYGDST